MKNEESRGLTEAREDCENLEWHREHKKQLYSLLMHWHSIFIRISLECLLTGNVPESQTASETMSLEAICLSILKMQCKMLCYGKVTVYYWACHCYVLFLRYCHGKEVFLSQFHIPALNVLWKQTSSLTCFQGSLYHLYKWIEKIKSVNQQKKIRSKRSLTNQIWSQRLVQHAGLEVNQCLFPL